MSKFSKFRKGSSTFTCDNCQRLTRDVDGSNVRVCTFCYEAGGLENELSDHSNDPEYTAERKAATLAEIDSLYNAAVLAGGFIAGYPKNVQLNADKGTTMNATTKLAAVAANLTTAMQIAAVAHLESLKGVAKPVAAVRSLVEEFPLLSRAEVIAICTTRGINKHTANTQYQFVRKTLH